MRLKILILLLISIGFIITCTNSEWNNKQTTKVKLEKNQDTLQFKVTLQYGVSEVETIVHLGKLDFDFYRKYFYVPYYYPEKMVDTNFKNDTITTWSDTTKVGNFYNNWSQIIIYDSFSRVISYSYSSCILCSELAYDYHFFYNQQNQVIKMTKNHINDNDFIEFKYDTYGNIVNLKIFRGSELEKEIRLINRK